MSILRADSIRDRAGTGAPDFPNGLTGNVTGTATTATALSGTPNITVGTVSGTDATFSGNLTVNGTTTTIDTAVTAVDSLAVDGNVGVGTTNPVTKLVVASSDSGHADMRFQNSTTGYLTNNGFWVGINNDENALIYNYHNSDLLFATNSAVRLNITSTGTAIFKNGLAEKFHGGTTLQADSTLGLSEGNLFYRSSNETGGAQAVNFTGIHGVLAIGEAASFTVVITPNGSGAINAVQVDGVAQSVLRWSGGSAPSASASGKDVYTFTIFKTGGTTTDYEIYGAATNYA
jgi:hypothetical protein